MLASLRLQPAPYPTAQEHPEQAQVDDRRADLGICSEGPGGVRWKATAFRAWEQPYRVSIREGDDSRTYTGD